MPVDGRFVVRPYEDGDETQILELFTRSFPHAQRTVEHFRWKYLENPFGNRRISLAFDMETDGRLVAHYGGYPVPFRIGGSDVETHQIGDTMTDVSVRHVGRGPTSILARTTANFYQTFCEGRVAFNYGFNTSSIQKFGARFLRCDVVEPVTWRMRSTSARPLAPLGMWHRMLQGWRVDSVSSADEEWDRFFERVAASYSFCVKRAAAYVRWRYFDCPDTRYVVLVARKRGRLAGWAVFRERARRLLWGDALIDPALPETASVLLRHATALLQPESIEAWFPPRPGWLVEPLRDLGLETAPEPQDLSVICSPFILSEATARMREELYYTWSDSDLF